jgi:hypothetical protein
MSRLRHFKSNVGWGEVLKTILIGILAISFAVINPEPPFSLVMVLVALSLPAILRKILAGNPEFWSGVIAKAALVLVVTAFALSFFKEKLAGTAGVPTALFTMLALYSSAFFWLWSDPNVVRLPREP